GLSISGVDLCIVREFPFANLARIERLPRLVLRSPMLFQQLPTAVGERHQGRTLAVAIERSHRSNQPCRSQALQVSATQIAITAAVVSQLIDRHHAESA